MSSTAATADGGRNIKGLAAAQRLGRSLLLPIASLPVAALLARLGADDLLGPDGLGWDEVAAVIGSAGNTLFENLGMLFAVGVAIGWARRSDGSTALAAVVGYLVFTAVGEAMSPFVLPEGSDPIDYGVSAPRFSGSATTASSCRRTWPSSGAAGSSRWSPRSSRCSGRS
jgi:PTS system N-acetylglucosamine-specific IIC component